MKADITTNFHYHIDTIVIDKEEQPDFVEIQIKWRFHINKKDDSIKCDIDVISVEGTITGIGYELEVKNPNITVQWDYEADKIEVTELTYNSQDNSIIVKF